MTQSENENATVESRFKKDVQNCGWSQREVRETLRAHGWTNAQIRVVTKRLVEVENDEENFQYSDNFRFARKGNDEEVADYKAIADSGCCGSCDEELMVKKEGKEEEIILFGFNYGH